jgi:cellulose synthase/poly-beta-1,6-N-acetylglucosamine synthase-like glycosyltransferase
MKLFFLVLARDEEHVDKKVKELNGLGVPYLIVCGEQINHPNVVYRKPRGKYDAINFGARLVPKDVDVVVLNDVDTKIYGLESALKCFSRKKVALVFSKVVVRGGPQTLFYLFLDPIRSRIPITASGEFMLIRHDVFREVLPLKPCKAEDSYISFKVLELGYRVIFCKGSYAETDRTKTIEKEEMYKRKTVAGLYQALSYTKPPKSIKLFYVLLPLISPLLLVSGKKGYYWMRGILLGFTDYLRGDRVGLWQSTYMK